MKAAKTDKFYTFLYSALGALATLLDIALADDVAKVTVNLVSHHSNHVLYVAYRGDMLIFVSTKHCRTLDRSIMCSTG